MGPKVTCRDNDALSTMTQLERDSVFAFLKLKGIKNAESSGQLVHVPRICLECLRQGGALSGVQMLVGD